MIITYKGAHYRAQRQILALQSVRAWFYTAVAARLLDIALSDRAVTRLSLSDRSTTYLSLSDRLVTEEELSDTSRT